MAKADSCNLPRPFCTVAECRLWLALQVQVPAERVTAMAFSPDGSRLAAVAWAGCTFLYSRCQSPQALSESAAALGMTDSQAAESPGKRPHSQANPALSADASPGIPKAGPEEASSRLAWIEHGAQGIQTSALYCPATLQTVPCHPSSLLTSQAPDASGGPSMSCCSALCMKSYSQCSSNHFVARHIHGSISSVQAIFCMLVALTMGEQNWETGILSDGEAPGAYYRWRWVEPHMQPHY